MRLEGKVALITGGGGGIGRQTALAFAAEGARVVATDVNSEAGAETVSLVEEAGGEAIYRDADVSKAADCEAMVQAAESEFGRLDILFNNAGIMHPEDGDAVATEEEIWDLTMNINLKGVFFGCKYGIPAILRAGGGSVINTASFVAVLGAATPQLAYTASKGGVLALTRELAAEWGHAGVRVNALAPGWIRTPMTEALQNNAERSARVMARVPLGRWGEADDVAQVDIRTIGVKTHLQSQRFAFLKARPRLMGSPFRFRKYGDAGMTLSELLPHTGRLADELALIRTVQTEEFNHGPAQVFMQTGFGRQGRPSLGSWVTYGLGSAAFDLPAFVVLPDPRGLGIDPRPVGVHCGGVVVGRAIGQLRRAAVDDRTRDF